MLIELPQDALFSWRKKAHERFLALGFPKQKQSGFEYLPLSELKKIWPKPAAKKTLEKRAIEEAILSPRHIVFVDGVYEPSLSSAPEGLICIPLEAALKSYGLFLQNRWSKTYKDETDPFAALNGVQQSGGAFLYVPPGLHLPEVHLLSVHTSSDLVSPRLQITLGKGASMSLLQTTHSLQGEIFSNSAIDLSLEAGSLLRLHAVEIAGADSWVFSALRASLKRDARIELFHATNGGKSVRFAPSIELLEENSSALIQGLAMLEGQRQAHIHALVEHAAPHCQSRQHVKMALNGKSRSSFEGKIYVRPIAQKTEAYQLNQNLLLSDEASANAKPNLEIFADDVKASHGATVSQLKSDELFYLRSRGLDPIAAKTLLVEGFCRELIETVPYAALRELLKAQMQRALR